MAAYKWSDAFYFIGAMGCMHHYSLRVQASAFMPASPGSVAGLGGAWGRSARVSVTHPASCPATPAVVAVGRVRVIGGGTSGRGLPGGLSCGGSVGCPGVAGGISGGSIGITSPEVSAPGATTATAARGSRAIQMEPAGRLRRGLSATAGRRNYAAFFVALRWRRKRPSRRRFPLRGIRSISLTSFAPPLRRSSTILRL